MLVLHVGSCCVLLPACSTWHSIFELFARASGVMCCRERMRMPDTFTLFYDVQGLAVAYVGGDWTLRAFLL